MKRESFILLLFIVLSVVTNAQSSFFAKSNTLLTGTNLANTILSNQKNIFSEEKYYIFPSQDFSNPESDSSFLDRKGNVKFLIGNIVASIGAYAWMTPIALNISETKSFIVTYTLVGAGGIIIPSLLTRNKNITIAQAKFKNYGQFKGILDGILLNSYINGSTGTPVIFSLVEGTAGYILPNTLNMSKNQVLTTGTYGLIGYGVGFLGSRILFPNDSTKLWSPFTVGGSLLSEIGGYFLSKNDNFTNGDSYALFGTSYLATGIATTVLFLSDNNSIINPTLALGLIAGTAVGSFLGEKYDLTGTQGMLTNVFGLSSGLVSAGMTALILPEDKYDIKIFSPVVSFFSTLGFAYSYRYFVRKNKTTTTSMNKKFNFNFDLNPTALFSAYKSGSSMFKYENQYIPIGQFQWKF